MIVTIKENWRKCKRRRNNLKPCYRSTDNLLAMALPGKSVIRVAYRIHLSLPSSGIHQEG